MNMFVQIHHSPGILFQTHFLKFNCIFSQGGIRVLVSLLSDQISDTVRLAATTAIAIMCCSDGPCQDGLRHADGFKYLVRLANSQDLRMAQVWPPFPM
jgi:hypothetical protein